MRTISGEIVLPAGTVTTTIGSVLIELRDVSLADAPSTVVASTTKSNVALTAGGRISFSLKAPDAPGRRLALRVQIDPATRTRSLGPSYLTTQSIDVQAEGHVKGITVPVQQV